MLKFIFMLVFMVPLSLRKHLFWTVQNFLFYAGFLYILFNYGSVYWVSLSYFWGYDLISYGLILLSFWICALMFMASGAVYKYDIYVNLFSFNVLMLLIFLTLTFSSTGLFMFYLFFESSLIPTLFLILGWGYQPERLQAGVYLLFYTLLASLPMLVSIFYLMSETYSLAFSLLVSSSFLGDFFYLGMVLAFLVKMPMFMVHLWLPKAHVEAPVSGSMILAGVLLKLGGYGLLRVYSFLGALGSSFNFFWIGVSLMGGLLVSLICLRQTDLSALIAYSSVAHMGIVLGGLMTMTYWGFCGSYSLMVAHGLCSSGLFCLANISYERLGSRSLLINRGLLNFMPSLSLWWFLFCAGNMAAPPTMNLLGEISLLNSLVGWSWVTMLTLLFLSFFGAAYTLYLYSYSQHGSVYSGIYSCYAGVSREYLLLFLHWLPLNLLVVSGDTGVLWL